MNLTNERLNEFERLLDDMSRGFGRKRSTTDLRAPAGSGQQRANASGTGCAGVLSLALVLGFVFAMTWLILTHV